jgi:hypothetical protein
MDMRYLTRNVNEGFSGGEKKRNEILQARSRTHTHTLTQPRDTRSPSRPPFKRLILSRTHTCTHARADARTHASVARSWRCLTQRWLSWMRLTPVLTSTRCATSPWPSTACASRSAPC